MPEKHGLGKAVHAGREMVWGKGALAGGFVFLSGAEARSDDTDRPVEGEERSDASTLLIVGLAKPEMLVEIDCVAYRGVDSPG